MKLIEKQIDNAIILIKEELQESIKKHPNYTQNIYKAVAIISEELGELAQAVLKYQDEKGYKHQIYNEAIQVAAMALKFLVNFDNFVDPTNGGEG